MLTFTDANFDECVLKAGLPVLVEFTAHWCPPCNALAPHLEALADANSGRLVVGAVEVDDNPTLVAKFEIQAIPALVVFVGGEVVDEFEGAPPRDLLIETLAPYCPGVTFDRHRADETAHQMPLIPAD